MVEFYTLCLDYGIDISTIRFSLQTEMPELFNIEKIIKTNSHKYKVGLPTRFIDVIPRKVIGGWQ